MENNDYTLEQMRADYQALKDSLARQEIVNGRLLRDAMRSKVSSIRARSLVSILCGVFVILAAPAVFHYNPVMKASWWFIGATEILMAACIFFELKFTHRVNSADLTSCDLLSFSKDVKKLRQNYKDWIKWGVTLGIAWAGWLCTEVWMNSTEPKLAIAMIIGLGGGLLLGMVLGLKLNKDVTKACDEIISNIESI